MIPVLVCRNFERHRLKVQKVHKVDAPTWEQWQGGLKEGKQILSELPIFLFLVYEKGPKNVKRFHLSERGGPMHRGPTCVKFLSVTSTTSSTAVMLDVGCYLKPDLGKQDLAPLNQRVSGSSLCRCTYFDNPSLTIC